MRTCKTCKEEKEESEYYIVNKKRGYLGAHCKSCHKRISAENTKKAREKRKLLDRSHWPTLESLSYKSKVCSACGESKPLTSFRRCKGYKDFIHSQCKHCETEYHKQKTVDPRKKYASWKRWSKRKWHIVQYHCIRTRVKDKSTIDFQADYLLELYEKQNGICPYFGVAMSTSIEHSHYPWTPSVDRIDSSKGYTKDNICLCCLAANSAKSDSTPEVWEKFLKDLRG